mgnify:CR=1 FL=1
MKKLYFSPSVLSSDLKRSAFPAVVAAVSKVAALAGGYAAGRAVTNAMRIYPIERKLATIHE